MRPTCTSTWAVSPKTPTSADLSCERTVRPWPRPGLRLTLEDRLALLLAVDFANHRHPFFDLRQHAQIGGPRLRQIVRRHAGGFGGGLSRGQDTLGHQDTLGNRYGLEIARNRVCLPSRSFADEFDQFVRFSGLSLTLTVRVFRRRPQLTSAAPQVQVKRAFAAVGRMRLLDTDDKA